jgi:glycosyltransferase involved in cell wall biosynthesis
MTGVIRVAFVHHFYPHYRLPVMRYLDADPSLACTFFGDDHEPQGLIAPASIPDGMRFVHAPAVRVIGPVMWQWGAVQAALSPRFDVLVLHGVAYWASMWVAAAVGRAVGKRVFLWGHGYLYPPRGLKGLLRRCFYSLPHAHLLYGRNAKEIGRAHGWSDGGLHVVHNGFDPKEVEAAALSVAREEGATLRAELFGDGDALVVACPTRLISLRRLDLLVGACALLRRRRLPVCLLLIGSGPEQERLVALCSSAGVPAHFEGSCYDEGRIARLLLASHVGAAPGCVGLSAIHCMSYGLPVVTHGDARYQMPEFEAVIPGQTGSLFARGDVDSLAVALEYWLRDSHRRAEAANACRSVVARFWNARTQALAISRALRGAEADDLWQFRELHQ